MEVLTLAIQQETFNAYFAQLLLYGLNEIAVFKRCSVFALGKHLTNVGFFLSYYYKQWPLDQITPLICLFTAFSLRMFFVFLMATRQNKEEFVKVSGLQSLKL